MKALPQFTARSECLRPFAVGERSLTRSCLAAGEKLGPAQHALPPQDVGNLSPEHGRLSALLGLKLVVMRLASPCAFSQVRHRAGRLEALGSLCLELGYGEKSTTPLPPPPGGHEVSERHWGTCRTSPRSPLRTNRKETQWFVRLKAKTTLVTATPGSICPSRPSQRRSMATRQQVLNCPTKTQAAHYVAYRWGEAHAKCGRLLYVDSDTGVGRTCSSVASKRL